MNYMQLRPLEYPKKKPLMTTFNFENVTTTFISNSETREPFIGICNKIHKLKGSEAMQYNERKHLNYVNTLSSPRNICATSDPQKNKNKGPCKIS